MLVEAAQLRMGWVRSWGVQDTASKPWCRLNQRYWEYYSSVKVRKRHGVAMPQG